MRSIIEKPQPAEPNRDSITPLVTRFDAGVPAEGVLGPSFETVLAGRRAGLDLITSEMAHDRR